MIENLAQRVTKAGMGSAALLFLSGYKPLGRLGGNALHLFSPFIGVFIPNIDAYGYLLQDPVNLDILLGRLEEIEEERGRQQKAMRNERKARARERKLRAHGLPPSGQPGGGDTQPSPGGPPAGGSGEAGKGDRT